MPSPLEIIFGRKPKAISINRGPYVMEMADGENAEITMYGEIVERHPKHWWTGEPLEGDFIVQDEFLRDLENLSGAKTLTIRMHSIGGDAGVSILIHNRLRDLSAKGMLLTCIVDGVAMSGGSLIMCACDNVEVNPSSLVMIHKAAISLFDSCNADDLRKHASALDAWDKAQVSIYKRKAPGLSDMTISNMMAKTTYMTGTEAVEKGFADKLLENAEPLHIAASADGRSLFVRGRQFYLTPGMFAPDTIPTVAPEAAAPVEANKNQPAQTGSEGGKTMAKNLEELRAENAELAEALLAEARAAVSASGAAVPAPAPAPAVTPAPAPQSSGGDDPAQAERKRIQEIDALAGLFDTETINAAKYGDHPCTAQEMVYQAAQKASQQGGTFLAALEADTAASGAQDVGAANGAGSDGAGGTGGPDSPQAVVAQAQADAKAFNERKREVR